MRHFVKNGNSINKKWDIIRAIADERISKNMTQKDLAEKTGINQADISKMENGTRNPSLKVLKRLADGTNMESKLVFIPKVSKNTYFGIAGVCVLHR